MAEVTEGIVTRRALLGGLGAGSVALAGGAAAAGAAGASPAVATPGTAAVPSGAPPVTSAASPHQPGISYVYRTGHEFQLIGASTVRLAEWGVALGNEDPGDMDFGARGEFVASVEVPAGSLLYDLEFYVFSEVADAVRVTAYMWVPGVGPAEDLGFGSWLIPPTDPSEPGVVPLRVPVPGDRVGPWPEGSRLLLVAFMENVAGVGLDGARVGFSQAPRQLMMLTDPVRVYDSRTTGGALVPNALRVIPLGGAVPTSAAGALVSLSITASQGTGTLRAGRAGVSPTATALQWSRTGDKVTNLVSTGISADQEMVVQSISATGATHVIAEVVGYLM